MFHAHVTSACCFLSLITAASEAMSLLRIEFWTQEDKSVHMESAFQVWSQTSAGHYDVVLVLGAIEIP